MKIKVQKGTVALRLYDIKSSMQHWALGFEFPDGTAVWFEVEGVSKEETGSQNNVICHGDSRKYTTMEPIGTIECDDTEKLLCDIKEWNSNWLTNNKNYSLTDANCQKYVSDFGKSIFGVKIISQNSSWGNSIISASCAVGAASFVGGVVSIALYMLGIEVIGSHA